MSHSSLWNNCEISHSSSDLRCTTLYHFLYQVLTTQKYCNVCSRLQPAFHEPRRLAPLGGCVLGMFWGCLGRGIVLWKGGHFACRVLVRYHVWLLTFDCSLPYNILVYTICSSWLAICIHLFLVWKIIYSSLFNSLCCLSWSGLCLVLGKQAWIDPGYSIC